MNHKNLLLLLILFSLLKLSAEKWDVTIKYLGLNVVYVTMEDTGNELIIKARSSALASLASGMDNQYSSKYQNDYMPETYAKIINQKNYAERRMTKYNRELGIADFTSFIDSTRNRSYGFHPEARDFFSALLYLCRNYQISGGVLWLDAAQLIWKAEYQIIGREKLRTFRGRKETIKVKVTFTKISDAEAERSDMLTNNLVSEKNALYLWITDDEDSLPVKAKFAMRPFSVTWKMTGYEK